MIRTVTSSNKLGLWAFILAIGCFGPALAQTPTPAEHISSAWDKPIPSKTIFQGNEGNCPFDGNKSDPDQFALKNRADAASEYNNVTWSAIDELDFPGKSDRKYAKPHRVDWTPDQLAVIKPFEGIPVRVVGYIVAIKPQTGNKEGTNCKFSKAGDVDAHIAFVGAPKRANGKPTPESESVVIEWTPRFLKDHPKWTKAKLKPWLKTGVPVRISGFLMVDPDHVGHLGKYRNTLWEVHPITRIEVFQNGAFVDLDSL